MAARLSAICQARPGSSERNALVQIALAQDGAARYLLKPL